MAVLAPFLYCVGTVLLVLELTLRASLWLTGWLFGDFRIDGGPRAIPFTVLGIVLVRSGPRHRADRARRPGRRYRRETAAGQAGRRPDSAAGRAVTRVVLAEDGVLLREGLVGVLVRSGFEVGDAAGLEAAVREHGPELVITDMRP